MLFPFRPCQLHVHRLEKNIEGLRWTKGPANGSHKIPESTTHGEQNKWISVSTPWWKDDIKKMTSIEIEKKFGGEKEVGKGHLLVWDLEQRGVVETAGWLPAPGIGYCGWRAQHQRQTHPSWGGHLSGREGWKWPLLLADHWPLHHSPSPTCNQGLL